MATARAPLSRALSLTGVEQLIFDPLRPDEVDLVIAMPAEIGVQLGRWMPVSGVAAAAGLLVTGAVLAIALAAAWTILVAISEVAKYPV